MTKNEMRVESCRKQVETIGELTQEALRERAGNSDYPRYVGIEAYPSGQDYWFSLDVRTKVCSDVSMIHSIDYDTFEDSFDDDEEVLAEAIAEDCQSAQHWAPKLSQRAAAMRDVGLRLVDEWSQKGAPTRLLNVDVSSYDQWRQPNDAYWNVTLEGLGDHLQPTALWGRALTPSDLEADLDSYLPQQRRRRRLRDELDALGADAWIDELTLRIIKMLRRRDEALTLAVRDRGKVMRLSGRTGLSWQEGLLTSFGQRIGMSWDGATLSIANQRVPEVRADALVGCPVTDLIDYAPLTKDMIIEKVINEEEDGTSYLHVKLRLRRFLFNAAHARVWLPTAQAKQTAACG